MIKRLIKFSASYTAIEALQRGALFLMLPIFTQYMTPEEYGIVSTALILISFLSILFSFAIHASISRYYHKYEKTDELKEFLGTNFIFLTLVSLVMSISMIFLSKPMFNSFFSEIAFYPYIVYILIIVATQVIIISYFSLLKAMQKLKLYSIVFNSYFIFQLILMSVLIINYDLKQDGYLLGIVISNTIFIPIISILLRKEIEYKISMKYIKESLTYSLPIIPVELIGNINRLIDRYYILIFIGLNGVGIYYIGVQIAGLINLIALAINSAYTPIFFKKYENNIDDNYDDIYKLSDIIVFTIGVVASILIILFPLFLNLFSKDYQSSGDIILYLGFTGAITSIYFINTNVLSLDPKLVKLKTIGIIFGTIINVLLGYILTRDYGIEGAAISTLIGFTITTLILIFIVNKNTSFKFKNFDYIVYLSILFLVLFIISGFTILSQILIIMMLLGIMFLIKFKIKRNEYAII